MTDWSGPLTAPHDPRRSPMSDARNRFARTIAQGAVATLVIALAAALPVVLDALQGGDVTTVDWGTVLISAATAALISALAYIQRQWLDPSRLPSLRPPGDEG